MVESKTALGIRTLFEVLHHCGNLLFRLLWTFLAARLALFDLTERMNQVLPSLAEFHDSYRF